MTYSVYQHWDPLKVMAVGISYPPELYDYIKNEKVRKVFYQIAEETEEYFEGENDIHPAGNFILTFFECGACDKVFMVRGQ